MDGEVNSNFIGPVYGTSFQPVTDEKSGGAPTQDTIHASEEMSALYLYSASMPVLQPPDYKNSISVSAAVQSGLTSDSFSSFLSKINDANQDIVQHMLDGWTRSLDEQAERVRRYLKSPAYRDHLEERFPNGNERSFAEMRDTTQLGIQDTRREVAGAISEGFPTDAAVSVSALAGSLMIGSGAIIEFTPQKDASGAVSLVASIENTPNLVTEGWSNFAPVIDPASLAAQLGYLGGMIAAGAMHSVVLTTLVSVAEQGKKLDPKQLAEGFARQIINVVQHPAFVEHILFRVVDRMPGAEKMTDATKLQMVAVIKTVLLATALAALYKKETGWLGEETKNLLEGDLTSFFKEGSLQAQIGEELQAAFALLTPTQKEKMITALSSYFKSNPEMKQLATVEKTFEAVASYLTPEDVRG